MSSIFSNTEEHFEQIKMFQGVVFLERGFPKFNIDFKISAICAALSSGESVISWGSQAQNFPTSRPYLITKMLRKRLSYYFSAKVRSNDVSKA